LGKFEQIWQYGSNETKNDGKLWELDGIAPQCPMHKLITFNVEAGASRGRIEITDNQFKNFVEAHLIDDYEWIFNELKDKAGEVISR
jgi:hypothetical protein